MIPMAQIDQFHDATIAAIITTGGILGAAILALIGIVLKLAFDARRIQKATEVVRHQVTNDHDTNLRVENDERHDENSKRLKDLENGQRRLTYGLGKVGRAVVRIEDALDIERTVDPRRERNGHKR